MHPNPENCNLLLTDKLFVAKAWSHMHTPQGSIARGEQCSV